MEKVSYEPGVDVGVHCVRILSTKEFIIDASWYYLAFKFDVLWFSTANISDKYVFEVIG